MKVFMEAETYMVKCHLISRMIVPAEYSLGMKSDGVETLIIPLRTVHLGWNMLLWILHGMMAPLNGKN